MAMPETLQTDRLVLRLLRPEHLDVMHALFSSDGHTIGDGPVRDRADTADWLARRELRFRQLGLAWYGLWNSNDTFIGSCGAFIGQRCGDEPEIGYEVGVAHRGHGFAKEAARAVTDAAHDAGHDHVWATIRPMNLASARVLASIGYLLVRTHFDARGTLDYYLSSDARPVGGARIRIPARTGVEGSPSDLRIDHRLLPAEQLRSWRRRTGYGSCE